MRIQLAIMIGLLLMLAIPTQTLAEAKIVADIDFDVDVDGDAVATDNTVDVFQARALEASAAAADHSEAYVDNSVDMDDSALTRTVMDGSVSHNAVHFEDNHLEFENEIRDYAFNEARGIIQVAQNNGVNAVIQQSITVQANMADIDLFDSHSVGIGP